MAFIAGAVIALIGVWLFYNRIQTNPARTFWGMVEQSLTTPSVTMQAQQAQGQDSIKQTMSLSLGPKNFAHSLVNINQGGIQVKTEVIGTPQADYTRYTSVRAGEEATGGRDLKTDGLVNVWAKSEPQLFGQSALGLGLSLGSVPVPIGQVTSQQRAEIIKEIKERTLYRVNFDKVKKDRKDGRLYYTYDVETAPFVYVQIMKLFASSIGVKTLDQIDPGEYRDLDTIKMQLTVDVRARQLSSVTYTQNNYTQSYSGYGVPDPTEPPAKHITMGELRGRFQAALQ